MYDLHEPDVRSHPEVRCERHIAVLSRDDADDPKTWSGTTYFSARALARHLGRVSHLGPMPAWPLLAMKVRGRIRAGLGGRRPLPGHSPLLSRLYARVAGRRLSELGRPVDAIFAPAGSVLAARLEADAPVIYSSDATARLLFEYYPRFTGLSPAARAAADDLERRAIARADLLLYPTRWAADSAVADYGADPARIRVLPYGANLEEVPAARPPAAAGDGVCRLLMVGVDWAIKGGAIALDALAALKARGIAAELTVVGCRPPAPVAAPGLTVVPFLDKRRAADRRRLDALYRAADFLIQPTRCECFGIVFCEAAAYGLPAIASRTGGVPELVREGETGHTLPPAAGGEAYAARIAALWAERGRYAAMRAASRRAFETRLNWDAWGRAAAEHVEAMLAGSRTCPGGAAAGGGAAPRYGR